MALGDGLLILALKIGFILAVTAVLARIANVFLTHSFSRMSKNIKIDETQFVVLRRLSVLVLYTIGIAIAGSMVPGFSTLGVSLLASAGIIAVVLGFAAQQTFSNVIAGVFIAIFQPFRVGDRITIKDEYGTVEDITLRHTVINTWQNKRLIVPNSKISDEYIINYSIKDPKILGTLDVGISYDSDIDKARKIMVEEALSHPGVLKRVDKQDNEFLSKPDIVKVRLIELSESSQIMRLYYWSPDQSTSMKTNFDLTEAIKKRFDREGIEIPYPHRTIVYKKEK
jgi:small-conductance mechanosensitive channel